MKRWLTVLAIVLALAVVGVADVVGADWVTKGFWLGFWIVIDVVLVVLGLINLARNRHSMETRLVVKWALLLVLVPVAGVIGYWFFRLENAVQRGTPDRRDEAASFLRSPHLKD
jgi:drug/metabolite transporter (DMT)-like permease